MQMDIIKEKNSKLGNIPKKIIQNHPRNTKKKIWKKKKKIERQVELRGKI